MVSGLAMHGKPVALSRGATAMTRNMELEEELKSTHGGYEEEMKILVEKNDDLTRKLGIFMGDPALGGDDDHSKDIHSEDYIIIDEIGRAHV